MAKSHVPPGQVFIIAAPSGTGKSTLLKRLVQELPELTFSVSHTTRLPRQGEHHGQDYFFIDQDHFETIAARGDFLEYAQVHNNWYGTHAQPVRDVINRGQSIVLDVDVVGAASVKGHLPTACSIFILPPNLIKLRQRLESRGKDGEAVIEKRLANAIGEMNRAMEFDFLLLNDDLEQCYQQLREIVLVDRLRSHRQKSLWAEILETFPRHA